MAKRQALVLVDSDTNKKQTITVGGKKVYINAEKTIVVTEGTPIVTSNNETLYDSENNRLVI